MPAENRLEETERKRSLRAPHPMTLVWITVVRGVMAIGLGLGLAFSGDRAPAALVTFMGVYWMLNGCEDQHGAAEFEVAEAARARSPASGDIA
jgi:uncharacterized membrane protein HdeD (DUF308 family)